VHESPRGVVRHALVAVHNLERLLPSAQVSAKLLQDVAGEVRGACSGLREAFSALGAGLAEDAVLAFANASIDELEALLTRLGAAPLDAKSRAQVERDVTRLSTRLDGAGELFDVLARTRFGSPVEVSLASVVRDGAALRFGVRPGPMLTLRVDLRLAKGTLFVDPHVMAFVVSVATQRAAAGADGARALVVTIDGAFARLAFGPAGPGTEALPQVSLRVPTQVPPLGVTLEAVLRSLDAVSAETSGSVTLALPCAP
jgi:hypothetical protein